MSDHITGVCTQYQIIFINEDNKSKYLQAVLTWLETDFDAKQQPSRHFWHNRERITQVFDDFHAMVVINAQEEVLGYMIWGINMDAVQIEIDIVEVREDQRRQGIFKNMLAELVNKYPDVCVLTASVLPQSEQVFNNAGWKKISVYYDRLRTTYYKIIKPVLPQLSTLPDGRAIAVFSQADVADPKERVDFYMVQAEPDKYKDRIKYFQLDLVHEGKLRMPLVTSYHWEGYIGVYLNQKLIAEGKARHLFVNEPDGSNLFFLNKIQPQKPELFRGFFASVQPSALPLTPTYSAIQQLPEKKEPTAGKATEEKPAAAKKQKMVGTI